MILKKIKQYINKKLTIHQYNKNTIQIIGIKEKGDKNNVHKQKNK